MDTKVVYQTSRRKSVQCVETTYSFMEMDLNRGCDDKQSTIINAKEHIKTTDPRIRDQKVSETLEILKRMQTHFEKAERFR